MDLVACFGVPQPYGGRAFRKFVVTVNPRFRKGSEHGREFKLLMLPGGDDTSIGAQIHARDAFVFLGECMFKLSALDIPDPKGCIRGIDLQAAETQHGIAIDLRLGLLGEGDEFRAVWGETSEERFVSKLLSQVSVFDFW